MEAFKQKFVEEATEQINDLEEALLQLDKNKEDMDTIESIFRVMHSLKGGSAMFGFEKIDKFTHILENIYDRIRNHELKVTPEILDLTFQAVDHLRKLLDETPENEQQLEQENKLFIERIEKALNEKTTPEHASIQDEPTEGKTKTYFVRFVPNEDIMQNGTNPLFLLEDLSQLGTSLIVPNISKIPDFNSLDPAKTYTSWNILLSTNAGINAVIDVFIFVDDEAKIETHKISDYNLLQDKAIKNILKDTLQQKPHIKPSEIHDLIIDLENIYQEKEEKQVKDESRKKVEHSISSIRVSSDKLDNLINWVSELVTIQAQLSLFNKENNYPGLDPIAEEIEKISRRLRDDVFSIRLIPIANMVTRFQRLVRELSNELGKEVDFITKGTETELDKNIIEMLIDPVMHIIRNSLDHGIEDSAQARIDAGKAQKGSITLNAFYSGTYVYIQIIDDGKGLDHEKLRQKAIEKEIITEDTQITEKEIFDLVFTSGFSTAKEVTNLSGRGVGMDVVKQKISELRGEVELTSKKGKGTTVTIKLPLTLSIIDGLLVRIAKTKFVIPLAAVQKIYEFTHKEIEESINNLFLADDKRVPFIYLRDALNIEGTPPEIERIVNVEFQDTFMGLTVDEIIGEYQAVLKPLGRMYKDVDIVSGATILGDGTVALVLDPNRLINEYTNKENIGG
ncbi:MAG TPA: chemotaxis protein CheA [Salinivirga sp.]|uniref:chemotaxis protein CheA n=1 Tax=Salinivirga sp. TaxID=1970192 RepID=UPI002B497AEE|nr:chemotaxis protein CheA [Salinivirga sp.]HKK60259.1 chemotaxis protein CheA [Salinivirga sp.]